MNRTDAKRVKELRERAADFVEHHGDVIAEGGFVRMHASVMTDQLWLCGKLEKMAAKEAKEVEEEEAVA